MTIFSSKVSGFFDELYLFLDVEERMGEIMQGEEFRLYCEKEGFGYPFGEENQTVTEMLSEEMWSIYNQNLKDVKKKVSRYYSQFEDEELEPLINSNDGAAAKKVIEGLKEESALLDGLVRNKLSIGVYALLSEKEEKDGHAHCQVLSYVAEAFSDLYGEVTGLIYEAERKVGYIPSPELLEELESEKLKEYLMLIFKKGYVKKEEINPSDFERLEEIEMVSVDEDGDVSLSNRSVHICRTVYFADDFL